MGEAAISQLSAYTFRPTVLVDEQQHERVSELLIGMEMKEQETGMSAIELRFTNWASDTRGGADSAFDDASIINIGSNISVYGGEESEPQEIFRGVVSALEAQYMEGNPPELIVLAEDACQRARMMRRTAVHENLSIADLAQTIAGRIGLTPQVNGFTDQIGTWYQINESDLAFLRRLLRRYDGEMQVIAQALHVAPRCEWQRDTIELELYSQLRQVKVLADLAHQVTEVTVSGWDPIQGQRVSASSTGANQGPGRGTTGAEFLRNAFGARSEHVGHLAVTTDAEAQALVDAAFDQYARRFVQVEGTAEGNASLRVGTHVTLQGVSPRFDNTYYVTAACHRYDKLKGYETDFQAECAVLAS